MKTYIAASLGMLAVGVLYYFKQCSLPFLVVMEILLVIVMTLRHTAEKMKKTIEKKEKTGASRFI